MKKNFKKFVWDKKGISIVIGYVLLIAVSIAMSVLVYQFLKTYVPKEALACPDDTSIFIKNFTYNCLTGTLSLTLQNNGKFGIAGYFVKVSNSSGGQGLATIDLSGNISVNDPSSAGIKNGDSVVYSMGNNNAFNPGDIPKLSKFNVNKAMQVYHQFTKVEIVPTRYQLQDNFQKYVSCNNAKIEQTLTCT
jgi:hypothetical protein